MNTTAFAVPNETNEQDRLAPQLAGARARGVADALSLLGLPAILLDRQGRALHVNREAAALMGAGLAIDGGRLTAATPWADCALQDAIALALSGRIGPSVPIPDSELPGSADSSMNVHALAIPGAAEDEFQLLGCVLVLERAGAEAVAGLARAAMRRIAAAGSDIRPVH